MASHSCSSFPGELEWLCVTWLATIPVKTTPFGKRITIDKGLQTGRWYGDDQLYEDVGVVADAKYSDASEDPRRTLYFSAFQEDRIQSHFALRTSVEPSALR